MTAADKILSKALAGSPIDSSRWSGIQAGLRDRAFFSAIVENARVLHAMRELVARVANGSLSASEARIAMRKALGAVGYNPGDNRGTIKDLLTQQRLDLIIKTNVSQARGYMQHLEATTQGALKAFPAYELVRVEPRRMPRDWTARWQAKGGAIYNGRMIALKTDSIWSAISRFGTPYPPFDYNSGMGVQDVGRRECLDLGVITSDDPPQTPPEVGFNNSLMAEVPFTGNTPEYQRLTDIFGDQITHEGSRIVWRGNLIRDAFENKKDFKINLGKPTKELKRMLPHEAAMRIKDKSLTVTDKWLDAPRRNGGTHRDHFEPLEKDPRNIPMTIGDIELIPTLWRAPERVVEGYYKGSFVSEIDTFDGGVLRMVVDVLRVPKLHTLYKRKKSDME